MRAQTTPCRHASCLATGIRPVTARALLWAVLAMGAAVLLSNSLVQYPINDWLTWGVFY
ncbi:hypothetical protein [Xanthomonas vasicola]|uniref:hypothetical protein n=1 Tax=Xanthomonas vasicola TaxID=56459 RepID=UPI000AB416C9|nr:hypothetical protein [Xanthomonas vasicola]HHZ22614.1 hypothetical protein [Xanthomonas vasicola pv. zeae]HHZ26804.1 hypothetical protein [Xanthomonas vasicola pv. zeae]HHZ34410.1 hypothetical protein [Xanthomonas vasicola pv. zeae]HHZ38529.1 hypothetical protein [Xanthomonas vasicola pv. zeae]HHZ43610.1 hypothetical protein [Xanthomonas vasicola pv. zeae]